jgi:subtilase family serine protease
MSNSEINVGYNVNEIRSIYGYDKLPYTVEPNGPEVNICIIIAYSYPNLQSDLDNFCKLNNIESTTLNIVKANPNVSFSTSWADEICLDTQWIHAICPYAKITVVEAASSAANDILDAIKLANSLKPQIINMSWGVGEMEGCELINLFNEDIIYIASSGDHNIVEWPSTNPGILAVSATTLIANSSNTEFISESSWSNSGCGFSQYFTEPSYQSNNVLDISTKYRMTSDLSIVGNPDTGCYIYTQGQYIIIGGTSLSAPLMSGTMAIIAYQRLLNKKPLYNSNPNSQYGIQNILYNIYGSDKNMYNSLFYDVTQGTSGNYTTMKGYDLPCGLGSPKIEAFVPYLVGYDVTPS